MPAGVIRFTLGAPIALAALAVFLVAMLIEWLGDLTRGGPHRENHP
jgi:hypothetical protein